MVKKFSKIFVIILIALLTITMAPTFAKQVTLDGKDNISKIGDEVKIVCKDEEPSYIFIIGKYGFTSNWEVKLQDIMLASRSIEVTEGNKTGKTDKDGIYDEMAIQVVTRTFDETTGEFTDTWEVDNNQVGTAALAEKFDLEYIDYVYLKERVNVNTLVSEALGEINTDYFTASLDGDTVTAKVQKDKLGQKVIGAEGIDGSNILVEIGKILDNDKIKTAEVIFGTTPIAITKDDVKDKNAATAWLTTNFETIKEALGIDVAQIADLTLGDLVGLECDLKVTLTDEVTATDGTQEVTYHAVVAGDPITVTYMMDAETPYTTQTLEKVGTTTAPVVPTKDGYEFAYWYLEEEGTKFDFEHTKITKDITLTAKWTTIVNLETFENSALEAVKGYNEFTITEAEGVENTYNVETKSGVKLSDLATKVLAELADTSKESPIKNFVKEALKTEGVKELVIKDEEDNTIYTLTRANYIGEDGAIKKDELTKAAKEILKKVFGITPAGDELSIEDLADKTLKDLQYNIFKLQVNLEDDAKTTEEEKTTEYTVNVNILEEVNVDALVSESVKQINKEYFTVKYDDDKITANITNAEQKLMEVTGSKIAEELTKIIKNDKVASVEIVFNGTPIEITAEDISSKEKIGAWLTNNLETIKTALEMSDLTDISNLVLGDLAGKTITVQINLEEGKVTTSEGATSEIYTIEFVYDSHATIGKDSFPQEEIGSLKSTFNYTPEGTYNIVADGSSYKVTGTITEQKDITGFGEPKTGFYFAYCITLDKDVDLDKVKVKIPKIPNPQSDTDYNIATKDNFVQETKQLAVLMEVAEDEVGEEATNGYRDIIIEIDGVPTKIRIDFSELQLLKSHTVSLSGITGIDGTLTLHDGDTLTAAMLADKEPEVADEEQPYREFAYWSNSDGTEFKEMKITKETENITLIPHWNLNSDQFVSDVIKDLTSEEDKFGLSVDENNKSNITIEVIDKDTLLSEMNNTSIPGAIAYALAKDEIKDITLQVGNDTVVFDNTGVKSTTANIAMAIELPQDVEAKVNELKPKIQTGIKELYAKVLKASGKDETTTTLGEMNNSSFKIIIGTTANTVTLVSGQEGVEAKKEYTFTFKADSTTVKSEDD